MSVAVARSVHVEHCMGTVFSIDIRDPGRWDDAIAAVVSWLHHVDAVFSTYRPDSDVSRIRRGELRVESADPAVAEVLELCAQIHLRTGGYFTAMIGGRLDPTGLVKGWATERASALLRAHGSRHHAVNGGGDVQLAGPTSDRRTWVVGIVDPRDGTRPLVTVDGRDSAVATSGVAERGAHLVDPFTGRPAMSMASATVIGPQLTFADAYATAAFVMGGEALRWIADVDGYEAMLVDTDRRMHTSRGWPRPSTL